MGMRFPGWGVLFLCVACGAPPGYLGPAGDAGADSSPSVSSACSALAAAECAELSGCASVLLETRYGSLETCKTRLADSCSLALAAPETGNTAAQVNTCAKVYPSWSCSDYLANTNLPSACVQPTGSLGDSEACSFAAQCKTGFCATPPHGSCGTCAALPKAGDSCENLASCGQRLFCLPASQVCGTYGTAGSACSKSAPCGAHLSCVGASATTGALGECKASAIVAGSICDPTLLHGTGCDYDSALTCNGATRTCAPLVVSSGGGPCDVNEHQFTACAASGLCTTTEAGAEGTCTSAAADGERCDTSGAGPACVPPARCIVSGAGTMGTCKEDGASSCGN